MRALALVFSLVASGAVAQSPACAAEQDRAAVRAPLLSEIAAGDAWAEMALERYACSYRSGDVRTVADLARVLTLRDTLVRRISPRVTEWYEAQRARGLKVNAALVDETMALGLLPFGFDGAVYGVTYGSLFIPDLSVPRDMALYINALAAFGAMHGGDSPYLSLNAEVDLIHAAEALRREYPASPYTASTQEALSRALLTLASLHPVTGEDAWYAGRGTTGAFSLDMSADLAALKRFVQESDGAHGRPRSRYHEPLARILATPPVATDGPMEAVAVAHGEYFGEAMARFLALLDEGVDVVGPATRQDYTYSVLLRYYPAGDPRIAQTVARAEALGLRPEVFHFGPSSKR